MKKIFGLFLIATIILPAIFTNASAQTADDIISNHINAIGGKDILGKITSIYMEGAASVMGNDFPTKVTILAGKGFKNETDVNGSDIIQCITDTSGWMINPMAGQTEPTVLPQDAVKKGQGSLEIGGMLYNFKEKGFTDSLLGQEKVDSSNAYKIKLSKPGFEYTYYIDPSSYYILKADISIIGDGNTTTTSTTFSNYKKTDFGYVVPYTVGVTNMGYDVTLNYTKIEVNQPVDPSIFAMPK